MLHDVVVCSSLSTCMKSCFLKAISMLCCGELTDIIIGTYGIVLSIVFCLWYRLMLWQEDSRKVKIPFWLLDLKICKYSNSTLTEQLIINIIYISSIYWPTTSHIYPNHNTTSHANTTCSVPQHSWGKSSPQASCV